MAAESPGATVMTGVTDQSSSWFTSAEDGSSPVVAKGTDASFWSVFKFQPAENLSGSYTNDYRMGPGLGEVTPYIYKRKVSTVTGTADTLTFYKGSKFVLLNAVTCAT